MQGRVSAYHIMGVDEVWIVDPLEQSVNVMGCGRTRQSFQIGQTLPGGRILPGFQTAVDHLFQPPGWWPS